MKRLVLLVMLLPAVAWSRPGVDVPDTMIITATRDDLAAVIAAVGRRMRENDLRAAPYAYTAETIRRDCFGSNDTTGVTVVYRTVARVSRDKSGTARSLTLSATTRRYEDGVLVWESGSDEPGRARWQEPARPLLDALPFAPGAADRYRYRVLERRLVGNTLLYRIAYAPRNRFDRLPSGEVWVDFAGWVMRRLTAHMDPGTTPTLMVASVPLYRLKQEQRGGLWLPVDVHLVMKLKPSPLVMTPHTMDIRMRITDVEVHGKPDDRHLRITADGRDPREFWLDPDAAADSLAAFWEKVDRPWRGSEQSWAMDEPAPAVGDSLRQWADQQLQDLGSRGRPWQVAVAPVAPRFNRVLGPTPRVKMVLRRQGTSAPRAEAVVGVGLSAGRVEGLTTVGGGASSGRLRWRVSAGIQTRVFGVTADRPLWDAGAMLVGRDPRSFFTQRSVGVELTRSLAKGVRAEGSVEVFRQRPLAVATRWNLAGARLSPEGNPAADTVSGQRWQAGLGWWTSGWIIHGDLVKLAGTGHRGPVGLGLDIRWQGMDDWGNAWSAQAHGRRWNTTPPVQDQVWLGDVGSLSGWGAGRLQGNTGAWASLEVEAVWDPWLGLRVPLLKHLGLQPVGLVEAGGTANPGQWSSVAPSGPSGGPLGSLGVGFQRYLGLPVLGARQKLRFMAAWPVGPGAEASGMRLTLSVTKGAALP